MSEQTGRDGTDGFRKGDDLCQEYRIWTLRTQLINKNRIVVANPSMLGRYDPQRPEIPNEDESAVMPGDGQIRCIKAGAWFYNVAYSLGQSSRQGRWCCGER